MSSSAAILSAPIVLLFRMSSTLNEIILRKPIFFFYVKLFNFLKIYYIFKFLQSKFLRDGVIIMSIQKKIRTVRKITRHLGIFFFFWNNQISTSNDISGSNSIDRENFISHLVFSDLNMHHCRNRQSKF